MYLASFAQTPELPTPIDPRWNRLSNISISPDGTWHIVKESFEDTPSKTIILNSTTKQQFEFSDIAMIDFVSNQLVIYQTSTTNAITLFNLQSLQSYTLENSLLSKILIKNGLLFYKDLTTNELSFLQFTATGFKPVHHAEGISFTKYTLSPDTKKLVYQTADSALYIFDLQTNQTIPLHANVSPILLFHWTANSNYVAFEPQVFDQNALTYYDVAHNTCSTIPLAVEDKKMNSIGGVFYKQNELIISYFFEDWKVVLPDVRIDQWVTNDKKLENKSHPNVPHPSMRRLKYDLTTHQTTLLPQLDSYDILDTPDPESILLFDAQSTYNYTTSNRHSTARFFDVQTEKVVPIFANLPNYTTLFSYSPDGKYIAYKLPKKNWVIFAISTATRTEIKGTAKENPKDSPTMHWDSANQSVSFIYDSNLYTYDLARGVLRNLTSFTNKNRVLELINVRYFNMQYPQMLLPKELLATDPILFTALDQTTNQTTLYLLNKQEELVPIETTANLLQNFQWNDTYTHLSYTSENYNQATHVKLWHDHTVETIHESSIPAALYTDRKQKIVEYTFNGQTLKGALFYPKDFDPTKQYPMVTSIYQVQHHVHYMFDIPSYATEIGFNRSLYTENGYFVFYPDIVYNEEGPGVSALKCVQKALKTVLKQEKSINSKKIGLFGHSHGGYETNFIITQTDQFATAVSGAGNCDLVRSYFSFNKNFGSPFYFQFENEQYEMASPFAQDKKLYLNNSPIMYVDQIKTPIFLWSGKHDENIFWGQSKEFFIGLQRYKIPNITLFYEEEGHALFTPKNQKDLSIRTLQWFDYFLKDKTTTAWIKEGTTFD